MILSEVAALSPGRSHPRGVTMNALAAYIRIARPDNWFKNLLILPGFVLAPVLTHTGMNIFTNLILCGVSACLIASSNYVINEWLDREYDKFHPEKRNRPSVLGNVQGRYVAAEYVLLLVTGLFLAALINWSYFAISVLFSVMGILYNVKPIRTKDIPFLDVLSESFNNVIRLFLGWFAVCATPWPPSSLVIAYWMGGAYLMAVKRYSEFRFIGDPQIAGAYRESFKYYTESKLLASCLFYALCAAFFGGVFLIKHKITLILTFPLYAALFTWYFTIGLKSDSAAQHPEHMYKERSFCLFAVGVAALSVMLSFMNIPALDILLENPFETP